MLTRNDVYRCFSKNLKEFVMKNGCRYILIANDCVTGKQFHLFEKTEKFCELLKKWEANSPNK